MISSILPLQDTSLLHDYMLPHRFPRAWKNYSKTKSFGRIEDIETRKWIYRPYFQNHRNIFTSTRRLSAGFFFPFCLSSCLNRRTEVVVVDVAKGEFEEGNENGSTRARSTPSSDVNRVSREMLRKSKAKIEIRIEFACASRWDWDWVRERAIQGGEFVESSLIACSFMIDLNRDSRFIQIDSIRQIFSLPSSFHHPATKRVCSREFRIDHLSKVPWLFVRIRSVEGTSEKVHGGNIWKYPRLIARLSGAKTGRIDIRQELTSRYSKDRVALSTRLNFAPRIVLS